MNYPSSYTILHFFSIQLLSRLVIKEIIRWIKNYRWDWICCAGTHTHTNTMHMAEEKGAQHWQVKADNAHVCGKCNLLFRVSNCFWTHRWFFTSINFSWVVHCRPLEKNSCPIKVLWFAWTPFDCFVFVVVVVVVVVLTSDSKLSWHAHLKMYARFSAIPNIWLHCDSTLFIYILGRMTKIMKYFCPAYFVVLHISCFK